MFPTAPRAIATITTSVGLLLLPSVASSQHTHQDQPSAAEDPATLFASSCASCHLPPDPEHETDRAWLNQVRDTACSSTPARAREALIACLDAGGVRP